jgi:hypothetical protein
VEIERKDEMKLSKAIQLAEENDACGEALDKLKELLDSDVTKVEELVNHEDAPFWAYWFAKNVIKGPWPEGEDAISKDTYFSYQYAKEVFKGPFPKGEKAISKDAFWSSRYNDYIKGRV